MIVTALCILENCTMHTSENCRRIMDLYWQTKLHKALLHYTQFPCLQICIPANIILGMLNVHIDKGIIDITEEALTAFLLKITTATKECTSTIKLNYIAVSLLELLRGANGLALNDKIVQVFLDTNVLLSLLKLLKGSDNDDEKLGTLDLLWTLATHPSARELLRANSEILGELQSLSYVVPAAKCALQKVKGWD